MENITIVTDKEEVSLKDISGKLQLWIKHARKHWIRIFLVCLVSGSLGFFYAWTRPVTYASKLSFVVEEGKIGGSLSSLAGQFGFDIGGGSSNGLLTGDNILLFLKSNSLIKETLLTTYDSVQKTTLADLYAESYKLKKAWLKNDRIAQNISFPGNPQVPYTRLQDSLLQSIIMAIQKNELLVERPEKKASFITVQVKMRNEVLSNNFCKRLVLAATDRYVQTKIKRQTNNVIRLQQRADSIATILNKQTYYSASEQEKTLDINPGQRTVTVNAEVSIRDKVMLGTIYGEVVKNLEIAKVQLIQETPTIQIVDFPIYPLYKDKSSKIKYSIIFSFIAGFLMFVFYAFKVESSKPKEA